MEIRRLGPGDEAALQAASPCFDRPVQADAARRFLTSPEHHVLIAYDDAAPAGFVTGVETTHPDKGTEMFLYELGVIERYRSRGIGKALVNALAELARERKCYGMWVATEDDNEAALATYAAAGGEAESGIVVVNWEF